MRSRDDAKAFVLCLNLHAAYRCRHSGACCESWTVPAEAAVVELVRARGLRRSDVTGPLFLDVGDADGSWNVARDTRGECVFFDQHGGRRCIIHREIGEAALPSACRHFPRKVRHDERATLISLSHFCPTAAEMLLADNIPSIVEAPRPLRLESPMEGLDASGALPPLLRPDLLCDIDGYDAWERAGIAMLGRPERGYAACLDQLAAATECVRQWDPGAGPLATWVQKAFENVSEGPADASTSYDRVISRIARLTAGRVGNDLEQIPDFEAEWTRRIGSNEADWFDRAMKNYLAARLFANWIAYQGKGLRTIVEWLQTCGAAVRHFALRRVVDAGHTAFDRPLFIESVRSADLLLLHVLESQSFARDVAALEQSSQR